ncbi:MAG: DUF1592 domain-containing protein [Acidobacteria bacterium]|nr:DUF1592 domain-containing protein [Acidobacteriota bacterium]
MRRTTMALLGLSLIYFALAGPGPAQPAAQERDSRVATTPAPAATGAPARSDDEAHAITVGRFCLRCHSDSSMRGGLTLESFDVLNAETDAATSEKMIRKLRAGMMPPASSRRPDEATLEALAGYLEGRVDTAAAADPNPGDRTFQRLNRAEYARTVESLLGLEIDVAAFLPPDTISAGFDNIADVQMLSATMMEGYLRAAGAVARLAVGDRNAAPGDTTYKVPRTANQLRQAPGAPFGSRGGVAVLHNFPADGDYLFKIELHPTPTGQLFGSTVDEQVEISVDGERVAVLDVDPYMSESDPDGMAIRSGPVAIKAGPRTIAAVFIPKFDGPVDDLLAPIEHTLADTQIGAMGFGVMTVPHLRDLTVGGPYDVTGVSETPTRRHIFSCRPLSPDEAEPCAESIINRIAEQAYRRPLNRADIDGLMNFYRTGAAGGDFEQGVRDALQAILASPHFLFRLERGVTADSAQPVGATELASRLAFFLWSAPPDAELLGAANSGGLAGDQLGAQVQRMLADPRAEALSTRFAALWFRLQDLEKLHPDALAYPQYDQTLARSMRRETELLSQSLVDDDGSVLDLLTADYTFVDERLAKHYGIPNIVGSEFRRVPVADPNRYGLLGHGSMLASTSHANRTSPVLRGKWIMEVLLGSPPPPPPPDIPDLEEISPVVGGRELTVREQLEEHRANPSCQSCHRVIDPLGLALENFDVTGAWRVRDHGEWVDPTGELYDGTPLSGPADLRAALLVRSEVFLRTFAENLLAYGLGRRVEYHDMPTVRAIVRRAEASDYRMSAFINGVIESVPFRMRQSAGSEATAGGAKP